MDFDPLLDLTDSPHRAQALPCDPAQRASWVNFAKLRQSQRDLLEWLALPAQNTLAEDDAYAYLR